MGVKMSIRYLQRIIEDKEYYITNNWNENELFKIQADILKAREELKELEAEIAKQYNKTQQIVKYKEIIVSRHKPYRGNIEIIVHVNEFKMLDGVRLDKNEMIYKTHKKFQGNERKHAFEYANQLRKEYPVNIIKRGFK